MTLRLDLSIIMVVLQDRQKHIGLGLSFILKRMNPYRKQEKEKNISNLV